MVIKFQLDLLRVTKIINNTEFTLTIEPTRTKHADTCTVYLS